MHFHRVFKTRWFAKAAEAGGIRDDDLCRAAKALSSGQGDNLGGNVWKKRLDGNRRRGIILSKVGSFWIYVFLFAKQDRENIDDAELKEFRKLAKLYNAMKAADMDRLLQSRELVEICNG
ncbi:type II toxin-antitoxin system RelE/ParE family toxin [Cupriavidus sp. SZY C1]|nr:type II toxin-antitoxin system RelE/ParE family toxin [Cupriavidus sp. SZY C1]MDT6960722.1 type II toxin-antitoxin system RelE/ParE family toxin [Cupriavidus sp. SZY C1]